MSQIQSRSQNRTRSRSTSVVLAASVLALGVLVAYLARGYDWAPSLVGVVSGTAAIWLYRSGRKS